LEAIQRENAQLKRLLFDSFDTRPGHQESNQKLLAILEKQERNLDSQLHQVQLHVQKEKDRYDDACKALEDYRQSFVSVELLRQETQLSEYKLHKLEDKKHKAVVSKGEAEYASKCIRLKIDDLRRERILFDENQQKKERELISIAHAVFSLVCECIQRLEATNKCRKYLKKMQQMYSKEEKLWCDSWREIVLRMESFMNKELEDQRNKRTRERRNLNSLLNTGYKDTSALRKSQKIPSHISSGVYSVEEHFDAGRKHDTDMELVIQHIGTKGPSHHVEIVRVFESLRASCLALQKDINHASVVRPEKEQRDTGEVVDCPTSATPLVEPLAATINTDVEKLVTRLNDIARSSRDPNSKEEEEDAPVSSPLSNEEILCMLSMLEIWVNAKIVHVNSSGKYQGLSRC
jgi:hypothetical protein